MQGFHSIPFCIRSTSLAAALVGLLATGGLASVPGGHVVVDSSLTIFVIDTLDDRNVEGQEQAYTQYVMAVRQALSRDAFVEARHLAERALILWPERQRPYLHLAQAEIGAQRWSPCIMAARKARDADVDALEPLALHEESTAAPDYWEGLGFHQTQRYDEALPFLQAAAEAAPDWAEAHRAYAECAFIQQDFTQAAAAYRRAFQLDGRVGQVRDLSYYATAMETQGDLDAAIAAIESALQRDPYTPGLHAKIASLYEKEGNVTDAYYHYTLEMMLHGERGEFSAKARSAANDIYIAVTQDKENPHREELMLVSQGMNDMRSGNARESIHALAHVLEVTRSNTIVPYLLLANAQLRIHQPEHARQTLNEALTLHPQFVPAMVMMARALRALDEDEAAQEMVEKAFELFPTYWRLQPENVRQRG